MKIEDYPFIKAGVATIAHDIGAMTRLENEPALWDRVHEALIESGLAHEELARLNDWLASLSTDDFQAVMIGEHREMVSICEGSPIKKDGTLLTELFADIWEVL
jgi:hypothetical protein